MSELLASTIELVDQHRELLEHSATRREVTRDDPLLFALLYLSHHLQGEETQEQITLNEFHEHLISYARDWRFPLGRMKQYRDAFIAPRSCGKTTWLFLLLPLWAAAHGHVKFIAAFSDSATQAENHLATFKRELDTNPLLREDFPELCEPLTKSGRAQRIADNRGQIIQSNEFVFMARGVDSAIAGMKVGARRPDLIILDDVEPGESNYSVVQANKRLATLQTVIFPLNSFARVILVGTTTMSGSIIHQCVKSARGEGTEDWITEEEFATHYFPALYTNEDGDEVSLWPERWPVEELQAMKGTRSFSINFQNVPMSSDGIYWQPSTIRYEALETYHKTVLSIDPATTSKDKSDWTGISVVSRHPSEPKLYVRYATHVKLPPQDLRAKIIQLLDQYPDITGILVEVNQGGDFLDMLLAGLPVPHRKIHQKESKEVRAAQALVHYERGRVFHTDTFTVLEDEMLAFPNTLNDDCLDSVVTAVLWHARRKGTKSGASNVSWAG